MKRFRITFRDGSFTERPAESMSDALDYYGAYGLNEIISIRELDV